MSSSEQWLGHALGQTIQATIGPYLRNGMARESAASVLMGVAIACIRMLGEEAELLCALALVTAADGDANRIAKAMVRAQVLSGQLRAQEAAEAREAERIGAELVRGAGFPLDDPT